MRRRLAICFAILLTPSAFAIAQQPPREVARKPGVGTASISGIVVTDDADARPLRRARVFLNSAEEEIARTTISDDAGRFTFLGLPAGRYAVEVLNATGQIIGTSAALDVAAGAAISGVGVSAGAAGAAATGTGAGLSTAAIIGITAAAVGAGVLIYAVARDDASPSQ